MKLAVKIAQVIVGLLFIVSGLVKANDPVGLGYKMQEFFELWSEGMAQGSLAANALSALHEAALGLSVFMITLEIFLGVALLQLRFPDKAWPSANFLFGAVPSGRRMADGFSLHSLKSK